MPDAKVVEIVAKAIYESQVKSAREQIDELIYDPSDIEQFCKRIVSESETAQVLLFYTYLDNMVRSLLALQMIGLETNTAREELFEGNGPLATFSARTRIAYHLGWITARQKVRLDAFRKVRNEFAHRAFKISMADPVVADKLKLIDYDLPAMFGKVFPANVRLSGLSSLLCRLIFLTHETCVELLVSPSARAHRVSVDAILSTFDDSPELIRKVRRAFSAALVDVGGVVDEAEPPLPRS